MKPEKQTNKQTNLIGIHFLKYCKFTYNGNTFKFFNRSLNV